ncbi:MAG: uridine kinase [Lachnospiraceae bacterium]|nr:uridine kinase [Lachnospiraceae bacterium]
MNSDKSSELNEKVLVIGIAGGTGSGKTTITRRLSERFGEDVSIIRHDNYYKAHHDMPYEERCKLNYDHPDSLDTYLMVEDIRKLKKFESIQCPVYDFTVHDRSDKVETIKPAKVLVVDGILILSDPELCKEMDIKIFVDTDADVRILRRIIRDVKKRGRSLDSVVEQYLSTVKPMHEMYVEPSKKNADIIIPEGGRNMVALDMLFERVSAHLKKGKENG